MTVAEILVQLNAKKVTLAAKGNELVVRGEGAVLKDPALLALLRENKKTLIELIHSGGYADLQNNVVPANRIPPGCQAITPDMLSLVKLSPADIELIVRHVPGGAANIQDIYPLISLQEGFLFHHLTATEGDSSVLHLLYGFDTRTRLDRYLHALQAVIDRHDVLRTAVLWEGLPEPVQVVWRKAPLIVEEATLDPAAGEVADQLRARFDSRHYRLDIRQAPMMRVCIAYDSASRRWLLLDLRHHLVVDRTTNELMLQEIQAHLLGQAERLPAPLPFRNFVARARLGVRQEEHEAFFRKMLGDIDELTVPFGLTSVGNDMIRDSRCVVSPQLAKRIRACTRALSVSAASLFHVAWALWLARVSGRDDVVFGTVLFGRLQGEEGADRVMGMLINTLPIRISIGGTSVRDSVRQTHVLLAELMDHEYASLALVQRCSAIVAPTPLFTTLLNYRHLTAPAAAPVEFQRLWEGIDILEDLRPANYDSRYPFSLDVDDFGERFELNAVAPLFHDPQRICVYVQTALEQLVETLENAPTTAIQSLGVLPVAERHRLLVEWNATQAACPPDTCIHESFEAQAQMRPDAVALICEDFQITYCALNARANRLAHHLRKLGVGPDTRVGICVERGVEMVVGLLAVLKAGGAYVPLDPAYPAERLAFMLRDSAPVVILTQARVELHPLFGVSAANAAVVDLQTDSAHWESERDTDLDRTRIGLGPRNMAYVIYTSGSTGQPKGVMVEHKGVCNLALAQIRSFGLEPESRVLQFASFSFDACVFEMVMALGQGASLCLVPRRTVLAGDTLAAIVDRHGITHATLPPVVLAALPEPCELPSVHTLIVAGDAPTEALVRRWAPGRRFINAYGPTETTVWATLQECEPDTQGNPPIGVPIANTRVYLLDHHLQPVPIGAVGELHIGGAGVARGYWNGPHLTAERFVADPFAAEPGARMYKTGDLARYRPDGALQFLGRSDFQVKLRGFRIELSEIETCLRKHPDVGDAVVLVREETPGSKSLVAYYTPAQDRQGSSHGLVDAASFRAHLSALLPEHMVPAAYVSLDAFPLTHNGKLDRKALTAPGVDARDASGYEVPVGATEVALAGFWTQVLDIERIGRHENFFDLGGDSLLAVKVAGLMKRAGIAVEVIDLLNHPTIRSLADYVTRDRNRPETTAESAVAIRTTGTRRPLFLAHDPWGLGLMFPVLAAQIDADIPVYGLPAVPLQEPQLQTMESMATRMVHIIRRIQPTGPYRLAGWSFGGILAYEIARQLIEQNEGIEHLGLLDSYVPALLSHARRRQQREDTAQQLLLALCEGAATLSDSRRTAIRRLKESADGMAFETVLMRCRELNVLPDMLAGRTESEVHQFIARFMTHSAALIRYVARPIPARVHLFVAQEIAPHLQGEAPADGSLGWRSVLNEPQIQLIAVPGNHFSMLEKPHVVHLGQALSVAMVDEQEL